MNISKKDLTLLVGWLEHIQQLADDKKTLNGDIMSEADTLDEIKALSTRSANFIKKHYLSEKTEEDIFNWLKKNKEILLKKEYINLWVARDLTGGLRMYCKKPIRSFVIFKLRDESENYVRIDKSLFPEITWENSPKKIKLILD